LHERKDAALRESVVVDNDTVWWGGEQPEQLVANGLLIADSATTSHTMAFALSGLASPRPVKWRRGDVRRLAQTYLLRRHNRLLRVSARPAIHLSRRSSVLIIPVGLLAAIAVALGA